MTIDNTQDRIRARVRNLEAVLGVQFEKKADGRLENALVSMLTSMIFRGKGRVVPRRRDPKDRPKREAQNAR